MTSFEITKKRFCQYSFRYIYFYLTSEYIIFHYNIYKILIKWCYSKKVRKTTMTVMENNKWNKHIRQYDSLKKILKYGKHVVGSL